VFRDDPTGHPILGLGPDDRTVGPLCIVLHSALRLTTWGSIPLWSMLAVVISGILGRDLYTLVPSLTSKHDLEILDHRRAITELAKDRHKDVGVRIT